MPFKVICRHNVEMKYQPKCDALHKVRNDYNFSCAYISGQNYVNVFFEVACSVLLMQFLLLNISAASSTLFCWRIFGGHTVCFCACISFCVCVCFSRMCLLTPVLSLGVRNRQRPEPQSQVSDQWGVKWIRGPTHSSPATHTSKHYKAVFVGLWEKELSWERTHTKTKERWVTRNYHTLCF